MANTTQHRGGNQNQPKDNGGSSMMDKAKDAASTVGEKVRDAASSAADMAGSAASSVRDAAAGAASSVGHSADRLASGAGSGMRGLGDTIQKNAPQEGVLGSAARAVSGTLQSGGKYIEEHGLSGIAEDLGGLIRRNPIPAMLIGVGIGVLISRALRS